MFKMNYLKFKMKYFYCVFTTHMASICEKKNQHRYGLFNRTLWKKNIHNRGLNKSSKTFLNQWESMGFNELPILKSNSILKRNSISKRNSMPKSNLMSESNSLSESNSIYESNSISQRIRYGKGIHYRNRIWYQERTIQFRKRIRYRKRPNHKSLRNGPSGLP